MNLDQDAMPDPDDPHPPLTPPPPNRPPQETPPDIPPPDPGPLPDDGRPVAISSPIVKQE